MQAKPQKILSNVAVMLKSQVIDARGVSINSLAHQCHLHESIIIEILEGGRLTEEIAKKLEIGTEIPASAWIMVNNNDIAASQTHTNRSAEIFIVNFDN